MVLFRRRCCDTLCTSGFMDDVILARNGLCVGASIPLLCVTSLRRRAPANAPAASCWLRRVSGRREVTGAESAMRRGFVPAACMQRKRWCRGVSITTPLQYFFTFLTIDTLYRGGLD